MLIVVSCSELKKEKLLEETPLGRERDGIVHFESPDPRGIDVAMLYRRSRVRLLSATPLRVTDRSRDGPSPGTRDILLAVVSDPGGDTLAVLVNHHPSKYGGKASAPRRLAAMRSLCSVVDSLKAAGVGRIVAMGDFNDTPDAEPFRLLEGRLRDFNGHGEGSIRFGGKWELIDLFYASGVEGEVRVLNPPFLTERDNSHVGDRPLRTYTGPGYKGGVSDHRPVLFSISRFD